MIATRREGKRGCGYRKPGGLYMVSGKAGRDCGRFPIPLTVCPTCSAGIKPARGWTWIDSGPILEANPCSSLGWSCSTCPLQMPTDRVGLIWIGAKFYDSPQKFQSEAARMGISRRIKSIPRDFVLGKTWVWLAHRHVIQTNELDEDGDPIFRPAVFMAFLPTAIEYVVKGDEDEEELQRMIDRGITLVRIEKIGEQMEMDATSKEVRQ